MIVFELTSSFLSILYLVKDKKYVGMFLITAFHNRYRWIIWSIKPCVHCSLNFLASAHTSSHPFCPFHPFVSLNLVNFHNDFVTKTIAINSTDQLHGYWVVQVFHDLKYGEQYLINFLNNLQVALVIKLYCETMCLKNNICNNDITDHPMGSTFLAYLKV